MSDIRRISRRVSLQRGFASSPAVPFVSVRSVSGPTALFPQRLQSVVPRFILEERLSHEHFRHLVDSLNINTRTKRPL